MKHNLKHLQSLVAVALCIIMAMAFTSCSDDDEPAGNDLAKIIVGSWAQDGDNDIITINANGTGAWYENAADYQNGEVASSFNWSYKDGWFTMTEGGEVVEKMRAKSVYKDKIVWQEYAIETDDYQPSEDDWEASDAFGYYDLWTWERFTK